MTMPLRLSRRWFMAAMAALATNRNLGLATENPRAGRLAPPSGPAAPGGPGESRLYLPTASGEISSHWIPSRPWGGPEAETMIG